MSILYHPGQTRGLAILGGSTPMVAVCTVNRSHYDLSPAFLLMAAAAVSFITILALHETYKMSLATPIRATAEAA